MNEENVIELDWYKDYNIKIIPSMKSGEAYSTVGNFKIDKDWDRVRGLPRPGFKAIYHKTFALLSTLWINKDILTRYAENLEKLYLLYKLGCKSLLLYSFDVINFITIEAATINTLSKEVIHGVAGLSLDKELKQKIKNKRIYFFTRRKWTVVEREAFNNNDAIMKISARFNFLILE